MRYTDPKVIMLAESMTLDHSIDSMLEQLDSSEFKGQATDGEYITEIAGRLCYKSFVPGKNVNVTKVREGNKEYLKNILKSRHGSVLEHATVTFAFIDVSRIFTHEIVRHRAGTAFSQESGRYVRLEEFVLYKPDALEQDIPKDKAWSVIKMLDDALETHEKTMQLAMELIPWDKMDFHQKKRVTSALRRYAPQGQVTNIIVTANHRAWRHIIAQRVSEGAEEEIVKIIKFVARILQKEFPNFYQDLTFDDKGFAHFEYEKV